MNTEIFGKVEANVWEVMQGEITKLKIGEVIFEVLQKPQPEQKQIKKIVQSKKPIKPCNGVWSEKYKFCIAHDEIARVKNAINYVEFGYKPTNLNIIEKASIKAYRFNAIMEHLKLKENAKTKWDENGDYVYYFGK